LSRVSCLYLKAFRKTVDALFSSSSAISIAMSSSGLSSLSGMAENKKLWKRCVVVLVVSK
jgi:hypothetical protein